MLARLIENALGVVDRKSFGLNSVMDTAGEHVNRNRYIINLAYEARHCSRFAAFRR
jgi:hypothetical protein